jgi:LPXTG-motif cell wall-anchored protein
MKLSQLKNALLVGGTAIVFVSAAGAQVKTATDVEHGVATTQSKVERGEIVYVSGNDVVIKMEDGEIRHFPNVPESTRIDVDGQMLGVHDVKPGMKVRRTITTTTTPKTVTTVQTVTGKVWFVTPPLSVILTLEDGKNQEFKIPKGQKFNVNDQMVDAFGLRKGMRISATKIVEVPETVMTQQRKLTGKMPPPPAPIPADQPILVAVAAPKPAPPTEQAAPVEQAAVEPVPDKLPKTGTSLPIVALLGFASLTLALSIRILRGQ